MTQGLWQVLILIHDWTLYWTPQVGKVFMPLLRPVLAWMHLTLYSALCLYCKPQNFKYQSNSGINNLLHQYINSILDDISNCTTLYHWIRNKNGRICISIGLYIWYQYLVRHKCWMVCTASTSISNLGVDK